MVTKTERERKRETYSIWTQLLLHTAFGLKYEITSGREYTCILQGAGPGLPRRCALVRRGAIYNSYKTTPPSCRALSKTLNTKALQVTQHVSNNAYQKPLAYGSVIGLFCAPGLCGDLLAYS